LPGTLHVTDSYATRLEQLPAVSYAAYGHIHRPQPLPGTVSGRYAGSPIPLDFGEEGEQKVAVVVEADPGRPAQVQLHPLSGGRPLRRLEGTLEQIREQSAGVGSALCLVTVDTQIPTPGLVEQVQAMLPEAVLLHVSERCAATRVTVLGEDDAVDKVEPGFADIFRSFLSEQGARGGSADRVLATFERLIGLVQNEQEVDFKELEQLRLPSQEQEATPADCSGSRGRARSTVGHGGR
jgi:exonuclease SbcD